MKDIYKTLKEVTVLYTNISGDYDLVEQNFEKLFKKAFKANSEDEAKELINLHKNDIDIIVSDVDIAQFALDIRFKLLEDKNIKITQLLTEIAGKVKLTLESKKNSRTANTLAKALQEEREKHDQLVQIRENDKYKLKILDHVINELLVKFEVSKDGIVTSTSKNFVEIFGFRDEYIVDEDITKIVHGSVLQKALLDVTKYKKPITEYISFNTKTGVIVEPLVVVIPHFDDVGYVSTYTIFCSLQ